MLGRLPRLLPRSLWKDLEGPLADTVGRFVVGDLTGTRPSWARSSTRAASAPGVHHRRGQGTDRTPHPHRRHRAPGDRLVRRPDDLRHRGPHVLPDGEGVLRAAADRARLRRQPTGTRFSTRSTATSEYALTCSIFASDRAAIGTALDRLRDTAGMTYVNDKPTGALIGRQAFGGGRGSGPTTRSARRRPCSGGSTPASSRRTSPRPRTGPTRTWAMS